MASEWLTARMKGRFPKEFADPRFELKDSEQLHLGFEQVFPILEPGLIGIIRLGAWREPFHDVSYIGSNGDLRKLYNTSARKAQNHMSAGLGIVLKENVQVDVAADFSKLN
jgi:hypothetical protein